MNFRTIAAYCGLAIAFLSGCLALVDAAEPVAATRPAWTTSRIVGSPEPPEPYQIVPAFKSLKFQKPTSIEELPGTGRLLITEMGGRIYSFPKQADVAAADLVADLNALSPPSSAGNSVSLFDAEPHPQFRQNRQIYVCYVHRGAKTETRVSRLTLTADSPPIVAPGSEQVLLTFPAGGHNAGCLEFGKDGYLYIATGDGSGPNPPDGLTTGQDVSDLLGAILRIDVDRPTAGRQYTVPADNPFVDLKGAQPEIWAYGLRNPWKFGVDPKSGDIFAADNGWESWEMVHRIVRGGNCGWPVMEGRVALRSEVKPGPTPILPPVKDHPHTEANSVIGGPVYRGEKLPDLAGSFVYGDYITGTIWAIRPDKDNAYSHTTLVDTDLRIVSFTEGSGGELFVLDYDFIGQIYELLPSGLKDTSATFPRRLSETGLFASVEKLEPAPGVVSYEVVANRWMDGATAQRWIAIPGQGKIQLASEAGESAIYPEGTVLVKHLSLPPKGDHSSIRLETQILHYERGSWRPYSYLWDADGKDAQLVESKGTSRALKLADPKLERTWHVNAVNECKLCHNAGPGFVLGFVPNQLNRLIAGEGSNITDQLTALVGRGVLANAPTISPDNPARLVDPHDPSLSLDNRARSYLHANCGMCHHPGGNAIVSFFLRRDLPFDKLNTNKGTGIGTFGMEGAKLIVPGDPYRSVLMYRMTKLGYARMPYISSRVVDSAGVTLIEAWIRSLSAPATGSALPATHDIQTLLSSTEGSLALALSLHAGNADEGKLATTLAAAKNLPSDRRGLFETFIPESQRRATLGPQANPEAILKLSGDRERGKLIFFSDGARCRACHEIDDKSKSLGPTLHEINKKYPRPAELLQHVLQPSLKIDEPLAAYVVLTTDGRVISGLQLETSAQEVVLKTAEKKVVRIAREEIDQLQKSPKSLMPDQILSDLTAQEAADLFQYIQSVGSGD